MSSENNSSVAAVLHSRISPVWRAFLFACLSLLLLGCLAIPGAHGQTVTREYDLKAVLLFNLTQFVDWPAAAFASTNDPIVIGILGRDPFGQVLDNVVRNETVQGRKVIVKRFSSARVAGQSHILFIAQTEDHRLSRILPELRERPVLTVSDIESFARRGGMVRFFTNHESKIKLRINLDVVKQHGLGISSKLLRVSEVERANP